MASLVMPSFRDWAFSRASVWAFRRWLSQSAWPVCAGVRLARASGESAGVDQTYTGFVQDARWFTCHFFGHVAPETIGARPSDEIRLMRGDALVHSLQVLPGLPSQRGSQCMIANSIERIVNARPGWRTVAELAPAYPSLAARASRSPA